MSLEEFHKSGLIWLANRALHPFGVALAVQVVAEEGSDPEDGEVLAMWPVRSTDPLGLIFTEESENDSRGRFFRWLATRQGGEQGGSGSGTD